MALPEQEFVTLAQKGLDIELRKKFEGMEKRDFFELSTKVTRYENLLKEEAQRRNSSYGTYYQDPNYEIGIAEKVGEKPITCPSLVRVTQQPDPAMRKYPHGAGRLYNFDVSKAADIFDFLVQESRIKLPPNYKPPTAEEKRKRDSCKYHDSWRHDTKNCIIFRNIVQEWIEKGILKVPRLHQTSDGGRCKPFSCGDQCSCCRSKAIIPPQTQKGGNEQVAFR